MSSTKLDNAAPITSTPHLLSSKQVNPLPIGPGGSSPIKTQMNNTNNQLTMLLAQSQADTKYDPPVPKPVTKAVIKENFISSYNAKILGIVGLLSIVYGIVAK